MIKFTQYDDLWPNVDKQARIMLEATIAIDKQIEEEYCRRIRGAWIEISDIQKLFVYCRERVLAGESLPLVMQDAISKFRVLY